jgi:hypothetical protein
MAVDPNWLYSSTVQATGALVAILGGFLASTLLVRIGERESLLARRREKLREIDTLRRRHADLYVKNYGRPPSGEPLTDTHPFLAAVEKDIEVTTGILAYLDSQIRATAGAPKHAIDAWRFLQFLGTAPRQLPRRRDPASPAGRAHTC